MGQQKQGAGNQLVEMLRFYRGLLRTAELRTGFTQCIRSSKVATRRLVEVGTKQAVESAGSFQGVDRVGIRSEN